VDTDGGAAAAGVGFDVFPASAAGYVHRLKSHTGNSLSCETRLNAETVKAVKTTETKPAAAGDEEKVVTADWLTAPAATMRVNGELNRVSAHGP
jgi:hypothetical protein